MSRREPRTRRRAAAWEAEVPCGVLLALEPTAADARAPHALPGRRLERLHAARAHYARVFAHEGLELEEDGG